MGKEIGKVVEVKGIKIKAELYELLPPYILDRGKIRTAPRINTYVKTKVGLDEIVCQITGEFFDEVHKGQFSGYNLELSVKGYFEGNMFVQGMRLLPMVAASIELLDENEFKRINRTVNTKSFTIGKDLFDDSQEYSLCFDNIIPSHVGVFGNTGSGKSNTLTRLLYEYANILREYEGGKLLIFDLNNEYGADSICSENEKELYSLTSINTRGDRLPINYDELLEDEWCLLLNASEATQRPVIKTAYKDNRSEEEYKKIIERMIKTGQYHLVKSMQYHMAEYISGISDFVWHSTGEVFYIDTPSAGRIYANSVEIDPYIENIVVEIPQDRLSCFLFKLYFATAIHMGYGTQYEFISPLLRRAEKLFADFKKIFIDCNDSIFKDKQVAVIQLANVNKDLTELVPSLITSHLFQEQVNEKQDDQIKSIVNIVVDEAHNLLYEDSSDYKHSKVTLEAFEKAIKEGRKFGLYLWISSQRPSDISQTIISQMHNYFIHKLVNPYDLNRIRKAVTFLDENAMDALTVLGQGECVVSGTAVKMPCFVHINQLEKKYRPNSENVVLFGEDGIMEKKYIEGQNIDGSN